MASRLARCSCAAVGARIRFSLSRFCSQLKVVIGGVGLAMVYLLLLVSGALAQGVGASGGISGIVVDPSGAVAPSATVTAEDTSKGLRFTSRTDSTGRYRFISLPPSTYDVAARVPGFQTEIHKGVVVNVGAIAAVDFQLKVAPASQEVVVSSEPPVVQTQRGSQANAVTGKYIADLPINRRDYLSFSLLMPGVSDSNTIADDSDFRVKQTPQSGLSFYGSNGRGNNVTVDGGEANDDAGGVRPTVSQDAVQEFQINRSNYAADLGSASGASINIVTKSGTNRVHGGLFGFFRNDALDARDRFASSPALLPDPTFSNFSLTATGKPIKNTLNRQQFGGTLGFPIKKDKTFLFVAYEGLLADAQDSVPLLTASSIFAPTAGQDVVLGGLAARGNAPVPCFGTTPATFVFLPAAVCAGALDTLLTINPTATPIPGLLSPGHIAMNRFIVNNFETNGGLFPFPTRSHQASARLDHQFNTNNQAFLRYNYSHVRETNPDVQALTGFSRGTSILNWDSTLQGSWFHQFSAYTSNEVRAQWNWDQLNVTTNDPGGPGLDVQGFGFFGRNIFLPSFTTVRRYEIADNLTLIRGNHTLRLGGYELLRGNNTSSQTFFPGRFEFLQLPGGLISPCLQVPAACGLPASVSGTPISNLQAWSLGLPAFYEQGFGDPRYAINRPLTAFYVQDSWLVRPNFTLNYGLRYDLDSQYGTLNTDKDNFAPRISFAWDPFSDHKTVVRAGYGIFYSPIYAQIPNVVKTLGNINGQRQIANTLVSILGVPGSPALNSAAIFQTLFAQGKILCGTPPAGANACITPADLTQFGLTVANTGPLPPGTVLFSGQPDYQNPYAQQASLGIERQIGTGFSIALSYVYVHTLKLPWAIDRNLLAGAPFVTGTGANGLPTNGLPFRNWDAPQCLANQALCFADPTRTILQDNVYSSRASALYQGGIIELQKRFSEHFTLLANYTYSKAQDTATDFNSDYAAFDQIDLNAERAVSDFDERHKVVLAAVLESPWQNSRILSGFQLSPLFSYHSGHPFNLLAGADINGDNHFTNDRPPGAPRNSGRGPDYADLGMRLTRQFKLGERATMQFGAEGFNILNRANFSRVNNIVGSDFASPFNVTGTATRSPSQPLGFTAALPQRQVQLSVRFSF